jgi:serine/threonine protein kinase
MDTKRICQNCGAALSADAPQGLCPQCLMKIAMGTQSGPGSNPGSGAKGSPPDPAKLATHFPQLEILELLGQGGMGVVYKARQRQLDRVIALKILPLEAGRDPAFAERFTREARALARLNHPNIVALYDFGQTDGLYYFIMEFVDGLNLRQLERSRRVAPKEALNIVPKICEALQYAHDQGVVHRDIKPENILLDKQGRVKIADFGLAKLLGHATQDFRLTDAGRVMGTPHYMAPEQVEHPLDVDHRADIYSLGVVFYEMLTGELPLGKFQSPSCCTGGVQIDVRLDEVVLRALEKEPARRYQQASVLKTEVETIAGTAPAVAATPTAPVVPPFSGATRPDAGWSQPLKRGALAGFVVFLLTILVATVITFLLPQSYKAVARVLVRTDQAIPLNANSSQFYDPHLVQTEIEMIQSNPVLENVVERLKLNERWGRRYGALDKLRTPETLALLKRVMDLRPVRTTSLIEIGVFSASSNEAAEIANAIAESYAAYHAEELRASRQARKDAADNASELPSESQLIRVSIVDRATPPLRPAYPNKPLNIALGALAGIVLGVIVGVLRGIFSAFNSGRRESAGNQSGPVAANPTAPTGAGRADIAQPTPRVSRIAIAGGIWALVFAVNWVWSYTPPGWALTYALRDALGNAVVGLVTGPLAVVAFAAPVGATVLGWLAAREIRRSKGTIRGLALAMFDAVLFPLLIADFWAVWLCSRVTARISGAPETHFISALGVAIALVADAILVAWLWRRVQKPLPAVVPAPTPADMTNADEPFRNRIWRTLGRAALIALLQLCLLETISQTAVHRPESFGELWYMALFSASLAAMVWAAWPLRRKRFAFLLPAGGALALFAVLCGLDFVYSMHLRPNVGLYEEDDWVAQHPGFQWGWRQGIANNVWNKPIASAFAPAVEKLLPLGDEHRKTLVDLDTGRQIARSDFNENDADTLAWVRSEKLDLAFVLRKNQITVLGLGLGIGWVPHFISREDLTSQAAVNFWLLDRKHPKEFTDLQMRTNLVGSLVFRTREGGLGLLDFLGQSENPPSVKIRYKLVQDENTTALPSTNRNLSLPDYDRAVALFNEIEDFGHEFDAAFVSTNLAAAQTAVRRLQNLLTNFNAAVQGTDCRFPAPLFEAVAGVRQALDAGEWDRARLAGAHNEEFARDFRRIAGRMADLAAKGSPVAAGRVTTPRFAAAIETVLRSPEVTPDHRTAELLDLDTAARATNATFGENDRETHAWIRSNHMDVLGVVEHGQIAVLCMDMGVTPASSNRWDVVTPSEIVTNWGLNQQEPKPITGISPVTDHTDTWFFQTREGGQGVLQILGQSDKPRGVKIRYKLAQGVMPDSR